MEGRNARSKNSDIRLSQRNETVNSFNAHPKSAINWNLAVNVLNVFEFLYSEQNRWEQFILSNVDALVWTIFLQARRKLSNSVQHFAFSWSSGRKLWALLFVISNRKKYTLSCGRIRWIPSEKKLLDPYSEIKIISDFLNDCSSHESLNRTWNQRPVCDWQLSVVSLRDQFL